MKRLLEKTCVVFLVAGLCLAFLPSAEAAPVRTGLSAARQFVANRLEGVQQRHQKRVERRQSGRGLGHILRCN